MASESVACAVGVVAVALLSGCASPFDQHDSESPNPYSSLARTTPSDLGGVPDSAFREPPERGGDAPTLGAGASADDFVRFALFHSPRVESAYQNWRAASERLPQVRALPDPRLTLGFFLDEVETRTGAQQARVGVQQTFPWPGRLKGQEDAASKAALAAWRRFEATRLSVTDQVVSALHELAYLDGTIDITAENLELLGSFEGVLRARYRVGAGSHPELIRAQVELGQLEDRLIQLRAMRPVYVADLNSALNRDSSAEVPSLADLPGRVASLAAEDLVQVALHSNPELLALDEQIEEQRSLAGVARTEGLPDLTVGLDYLVTDEASDRSIPESGDDPVLLSFGINIPLWRDKYAAGVRESIARRLSVSSERAERANRIASTIHREWFEHTDADRRVRLYEQTLIPKAEESMRASLAGFRAGETSFLDLLDTERTLLDFAVAALRARADRGQSLARLHTLVGEAVPTVPAEEAPITTNSDEVQP